jgi:hypothetical protein
MQSRGAVTSASELIRPRWNVAGDAPSSAGSAAASERPDRLRPAVWRLRAGGRPRSSRNQPMRDRTPNRRWQRGRRPGPGESGRLAMICPLAPSSRASSNPYLSLLVSRARTQCSATPLRTWDSHDNGACTTSPPDRLTARELPPPRFAAVPPDRRRSSPGFVAAAARTEGWTGTPAGARRRA